MAKRSKKILMGNDVTLEQWLELMEKRPKNIDFDDFRFPTDQIRDQFLANIFNYSDNTIINILKSFLLLPTGTLGNDVRILNWYVSLRDDDPEGASRLLEYDS